MHLYFVSLCCYLLHFKHNNSAFVSCKTEFPGLCYQSFTLQDVNVLIIHTVKTEFTTGPCKEQYGLHQLSIIHLILV